jgi:beta-galactosidase
LVYYNYTTTARWYIKNHPICLKALMKTPTVFINGKQVFKHDGWNQPFEVNITDAATLKAPINFQVFIENYSNEGGIDQPVKINAIGDAQ